MILNVKLLSGGAGTAASSCDVVAREGDSVESLKRQIEEKLRLSSGTEQTGAKFNSQKQVAEGWSK